MAQLLYETIVKIGTINEPKGKPEPQFALPSTVNWMKALAILTESHEMTFGKAIDCYHRVQRWDPTDLMVNSIYEQLFLSLHHLSALEQLSKAQISADFARLGIIGWYYGLSNAAKAMIVAQSGAWKEDHASVARIWDSEIAATENALPPFNWRISSLVKTEIARQVDSYRSGNTFPLTKKPSTTAEAMGASAAYLSGTAEWYSWQIQEKVKESSDFKKLGVDSFRSSEAKKLRDENLTRRSIGFLHQAMRYRGKANYREALFLAYGPTTETHLTGFMAAQAKVLRSFLTMAGAFSSRRIGRERWNCFLEDVDKNRAFTTSASSVWT